MWEWFEYEKKEQMNIVKLHLKNFRNYQELLIDFNNRLNIIIGDNAQGKTNILEAIYYLSITKSFLSVSDRCVIRRDALFSQIGGKINSVAGSKKLAVLINENGKKTEINDKEIKKHSDYIGNFRTVIFSPDNLRLIKEGPANRRRFLNIEISQLHRKYINILNEFNVVLKQRNEYLKVIKNGEYNTLYFNVLNTKFVLLAVDIYKYRETFINKVNYYLDKTYKEISDYDGLKLKYITNIDITTEEEMKTSLISKLEKNFDKEVIYGSTMIGPHRDDFSFYLDENDLLMYGSQGQLKMAVLSLKLSEIEVFKDVSLEYPVLLLDDLFSELDIDKRNRIINYLNRDIQTIITTTDVDSVNNENISNSYITKIEAGKVVYKNYD